MKNIIYQLVTEKLNSSTWEHQSNWSTCKGAELADNWLNSNFKCNESDVRKYLTNEAYLEVLKYVDPISLEDVVSVIAWDISSCLAVESLGTLITFRHDDWKNPHAWIINEDVTFKIN